MLPRSHTAEGSEEDNAESPASSRLAPSVGAFEVGFLPQDGFFQVGFQVHSNAAGGSCVEG